MSRFAEVLSVRHFLLVAWAVGLSAICSNPCQAQYSFDVKTSFAEKNKLQNVKAGVITAIGASSWATVTEIGEDYSLWILGLERRVRNDSMRVRIRVELRTRAMITRGRLIDSALVAISYDRVKAKQFVADSASVDLAETTTPEDFEDAARTLGGLAVFADLSGIPFASQLTGPLLGDVVGRLSGHLNREPSALEAVESLWLGQAVLGAAEQMVLEAAESGR